MLGLKLNHISKSWITCLIFIRQYICCLHRFLVWNLNSKYRKAISLKLNMFNKCMCLTTYFLKFSPVLQFSGMNDCIARSIETTTTTAFPFHIQFISHVQAMKDMSFRSHLLALAAENISTKTRMQIIKWMAHILARCITQTENDTMKMIQWSCWENRFLLVWAWDAYMRTRVPESVIKGRDK